MAECTMLLHLMSWRLRSVKHQNLNGIVLHHLINHYLELKSNPSINATKINSPWISKGYFIVHQQSINSTEILIWNYFLGKTLEIIEIFSIG